MGEKTVSEHQKVASLALKDYQVVDFREVDLLLRNDENTTSFVYEQTQQSILDLIERKNYVAGDRIPSERDLAERCGVHRATVRRAIENLIELGILEKRGTSGTYIPAPVVRRPISRTALSHSISEIVRDAGGEPGGKLLFFEENLAGQRISERLGVEVGEPMFVIKRLRTVTDLPFCLETTWIPCKLVEGLVADDVLGNTSFYSLLKERYDIDTGTSEATIHSATIGSRDAGLLNMRTGEAALVVNSVTFDKAGNPIEYLTSLNHPKRVMFTVK